MLPQSLLEVVTPASSITLVDRATLKGDLGIGDTSQDARLDRIIASVSTRVANYMGRPLTEATYRETWRLPPGGRDYWSVTLPRDQVYSLQLQRTPVTSIVSVVEAGTTLDSSLYVWVDTRGLLRLSSDGGEWGWASGVIVATYKAGWMPSGTTPVSPQIALPGDLAEAAYTACRADFLAKDNDPSRVLRSEAVPDFYSASYDTRTGGNETPDGGPGTYGLPAQVRGVLDGYSRSSFAF